VLLLSQPPTPLVERGSSAELGASQEALHLATAFSSPVWLEHLLPLLTVPEMLTLRATCGPMRAIVADMPADLGVQSVKHLRNILTCFPKADTIIIRWAPSVRDAFWDFQVPGDDEDEHDDELLAWLEERGNSLTCIQHGLPDEGNDPLMRRAWRAGVFRTVKSVSLSLSDREDRDLIFEGVVSGVEFINIALNGDDFGSESPKVERAALGYLRTFPALKEIKCSSGCEDTSLPPFIPPSLEALSLHCPAIKEPARLMGCLPLTVESSGAKLRRLELVVESLGEAHTARGVRGLLQACASTLKEVTLIAFATIESAVEVVEGLASCQHLERLTAPISTFGLLPPGGGISLPRMHHLELAFAPADGDAGLRLSSLALWGLMARGGLPALSSLTLESERWRWDMELGPAMVAAFEGVAGTLQELTLCQWDFDGAVDGREAEGVMRQLGEAIGKLRRLETLDLSLGHNGVAYHWIAQGMGEGACPALRSLTLVISGGAAWLACRPSIILPSLQDLDVQLMVRNQEGAEPLALACALTTLGYRGPVTIMGVPREGRQHEQIRGILQSQVRVTLC
jgi:hypothetical protein